MGIRMYIKEPNEVHKNVMDPILLKIPSMRLHTRLDSIDKTHVDNNDLELPDYCCETYKAKVGDVKDAIMYIIENDEGGWYDSDDTVDSYFHHLLSYLQTFKDEEYFHYELG